MTYYGSPASSFSQEISGGKTVNLEEILTEFGVSLSPEVIEVLGGVGNLENTNLKNTKGEKWKEWIKVKAPEELDRVCFWEAFFTSLEEAKKFADRLRQVPIRYWNGSRRLTRAIESVAEGMKVGGSPYQLNVPPHESMKIQVNSAFWCFEESVSLLALDSDTLYRVSVILDKPKISWENLLSHQRRAVGRHSRIYPEIKGLLSILRFVSAGDKIGFNRPNYEIQKRDLEDIPLFAYFVLAENNHSLALSQLAIESRWEPKTEEGGERSVYPLRKR